VYQNSNSGKFASAPYTNATQVPLGEDSVNQAANSNQVFDHLNKLIPGFGGLFISKSGKFTIYLTHPAAQKAGAREVLSHSKLIQKTLARIRSEGAKFKSASVANMVVLKGQYTFLQLHAWEHKVPFIDGVYTTDVDESKNKVTIGVKGKAVKNEIIKKLTQLNIPRNAVAIFKMSQPVYL
jgi:hypothetical protein